MRVSAMDIGLLVARGGLGVVFVYHGTQKLLGWFGGPGIDAAAQFFASAGIPFPHAGAWAASITETFGGLALLLGAGTRLVSVPLAFTMAVAVAVLSPNGFDARGGGIEYPLTLGLMLITLALTGGGRAGLDPFLARRAQQLAGERRVSDAPRHPQPVAS